MSLYLTPVGPLGSRAQPGTLARPPIAEEARSLAVRMATENESWGYTRIVGELSKVGHTVSRSTVRRILKERGIEPAPERLPHMPLGQNASTGWSCSAGGTCDGRSRATWSTIIWSGATKGSGTGLSMGFQNRLQSLSLDTNGSEESSVITIEKPLD